MENFQYYHHPLPSQSATLSANTGNTTVRLRDLPVTVGARLVHVVGFHFEIDLDPTYTAVPTVIGHNNIFKSIEVNDGTQVRFQGNGNDLRFFERLEQGGHPVAEALTGNATTNNRYWSRTFYFGPPSMAGFPTDFAYPCAALDTGEIKITWGNLTDISADTTAATVVVTVTAICVLLDKVRIPPFYERRVYNLSGSDTPLTGRALFAYLSLANSTSYDAFTAGDIAQVNFDSGTAQIVPGVQAAVLWKLYNRDFARGEFQGIAGDPRSATLDVNTRTLNLGTPTAAQAAALDQQPIVWCPPGTRLTKIHATVESSARLRWSGTNGAGTLAHAGRFLEQTPPVLANIAAKALQRLGRNGKLELDLLQGGSPGPFAAFLPYKVKLS
jgi:hypothetical protein